MCHASLVSQAVLQLMVPNITIGAAQFVTGDFTVKRLADGEVHLLFCRFFLSRELKTL